MRAPNFWQHDGWQPTLLAPLARITQAATARRVSRTGFAAPVPVLCCGNATVGGAGKTPLALDILARLRARGIDAHALTRGHGRDGRGVMQADPARHDAAETGDEALLLAAVAPCWVGTDRAASARAAIRAGAQALVMDDGLQNPGLCKTASLLVIDGGAGFGNGRLLPAGPLREPPEAAAARCAAAVMLGPDERGAGCRLPPGLPVLQAELHPGAAMRALAGQRVLAFAGIGRPAKFFATLAAAGLTVIGRAEFADHHRYTAHELAGLRRRAAQGGAILVTTTKDHVRLTPAERAGILPLPVLLAWRDEAAFDALLRGWVP